MPRTSEKPVCEQCELGLLQSWASSRTMEFRLVERAKMVLMAIDGMPDTEIALELGASSVTVGKWRRRFIASGVPGLYDAPRPGKPVTYDPGDTRAAILELIQKKPPTGQAVWDGNAVAAALDISVHKVWRVLRAEGICLQRHRSWCVSTDPEFASKAADVVGLYLNPPQNALVLSVDEKPGIQALERPVGYVHTSSGKIVRGMKSTYKRHGTLNLFAALEVVTGAIRSRITTQKRRVEFLEFMEQVVSDLPDNKEIHVILDNYCIHKKNEKWLTTHPNVHFHFTPTSASWLNMVEIWFGILSRKALKGASFTHRDELATAIQDFIKVYNESAEPFVWRKKDIKGSQLKNTITNLCN